MAGKEVRAGKSFVEIALRDKLQAGLKRAAARLKAFAAVTSAIGAGLTAAGGAILAPIGAAVQQFSDVGDAVEKMAARTGMSAEAVSELGHAADLSGTDIGTLEAGVRRMQRTIADAAGGSKSAQQALQRLGLSAAELLGLSPDQQLAVLADRLAEIENPAVRTAMAMEVLGKSGTQLLPMFADGAAGIQAMREQARALGLTISTDAAASAAKLNDALGTMWATIKGLTLNIGAALAPAVTEAANRISAVIAAVTKFVQKNKQLVVTVAGVAAAVSAVGGVLLAIGGAALAASLALSGLAALAGFVATALGGIGTAVAAIFTPLGLLVTGVTAAAGAWLYFSGVGSDAIRWLQVRLGELVAFVRKVAGGIGDALLAGDAQLAVRILWAAIQVAFQRGVAAIDGTWRRLTGSDRPLWQSIQTAASQTAAILRAIWRGITSAASAAWRFIATAVGTAWTSVSAMVRGLGQWLGSSKVAMTALGYAVLAMATPLAIVAAGIAAVAAAWPYVRRAASEALTWMQARLRDLWGLATQAAAAIGNAFSAAAGTVKTAFGGVWQSLTAQVATAAGLIGRTMAAVGQLGADVAGGFSAAFTQLKSATLETFSAIGSALAGGDFSLAAEIAWTSIKLAFAQGMAWVSNAWSEFAMDLAMTWDAIVTSIRQVWQNAIAWIAQSLLRMADVARTALDAVAEFDPSGLAGQLRDQLTFDVEGAIAIVEQDRRQFSGGLDAARQERDQQRAADMQRRLAETEQRLAELRAARQAALDKAGALAESGGEETPSPLSAAMAELQAALAEAAMAPGLFDADAAQNQLGELPDLGDQIAATAKIESKGTFNALALRGLGADSLGERQLEEAKKIAKNTEQIARKPGLAFVS